MNAVLFWLRERLRDVWLWPLNLVRNFGVRVGRIPPTIQRKSLPTPFQGYGLLYWLHLGIVQFFDLVGGPEIAQFFFHLITNTTPLTDEELKMASSVLGSEALRFQDVRIAEGGLLDIVFRFNGHLAFTSWYTVNLPRHGRPAHTRQNKALLMHELTHVYQYEIIGTRYMTEAIIMLVKTKRGCYDYGGLSGLQKAMQKDWNYSDFNREQQAQIAQDYFARREKGEDVRPYQPFIAQMQLGEI
ncbi:MAG: DUF4157 domain-containing protein [Chloroflexi bacterium]|nr:DUF4157 domain-containing protein [Chloroflexota bacterium]